MSFTEPPVSNHWLKFVIRNLEIMRQTDTLCDVIVRASDGQTFPAHACILSASSRTLASSLVHTGSSCKYEVNLDGIRGDVWERLAQFIYSGRFDGPLTNDILHAAEHLEIVSFLTSSKEPCHYNHDDCTNCVSDAAEPNTAQSNETCDTVLDQKSDDSDDDTVDYNNDISEDDDVNEVGGLYDDNINLESNFLVKNEIALLNNVQCEADRNHATKRESDSATLPPKAVDQKSHTRSYHDQFVCGKCPRVYRYKTAYMKHQIRHTEVKQTPKVRIDPSEPYDCLQCKKSFRSRCLLKRHSIQHSDQNPHVCLICGKSFSQAYCVKVHMRIHTGEKPCVCSYCGKRFVSVSSLNVHNLTHSSEKPHTCTTCGRSFRNVQYLKRHQFVHGAVKAYRCTVCGKSFRDSGVLNVHRRVHTGERPLTCPVCGKSFRESSALLTHRKRHTGEKPFKCKECGKAFTTTSHLYTHERTHKRTEKLLVGHIT